ncbi:hypothetical protein CK203_084660 [Vitis vinifera]|uniref:Uncharacterized protein n=1 Tax=Vitis vinifera TaxID=29760 RepID=A0A438EU45_VITVI|nr:hypothetical protein CK203_084660 [Vitis vinifera]
MNLQVRIRRTSQRARGDRGSETRGQSESEAMDSDFGIPRELSDLQNTDVFTNLNSLLAFRFLHLSFLDS